MKIKTIFFLFAIFTLFGNGCMFLYGVHPLKSFDTKNYDAFVKSVEKNNTHFLTTISDSISFEEYRSLQMDSLWKKHSAQPIQILYFSGDTLISYHVNCYARGKFTSINWNTDRRFEEFPPKTAVQSCDTILEYSQLKKIYNIGTKARYHIVIFWTNMLPRISKDAVNTVIDNVKKYNMESECDICLINIDKFYLHSM